MNFSLGEVVIPKKRIEPHVQEKACELSILENEASRVKIFFILCDNQVDIFLLLVCESLDYAVWWHNGNVLHHQPFKLALVQDVVFKRFGGVHDQRVRAEVEEIC